MWSEPHLYTFSEARVDLGSEEPWMLVARLDPATGSWERLPSPDLTGYGPWLADDRLLVDPDLGGGGDSLGHSYSHGGIFERQWIEMPSLPGHRDDERTVMTAGTDALVVGGVRPTMGGSQHELLDDVWTWRSGRSG